MERGARVISHDWGTSCLQAPEKDVQSPNQTGNFRGSTKPSTPLLPAISYYRRRLLASNTWDPTDFDFEFPSLHHRISGPSRQGVDKNMAISETYLEPKPHVFSSRCGIPPHRILHFPTDKQERAVHPKDRIMDEVMPHEELSKVVPSTGNICDRWQSIVPEVVSIVNDNALCKNQPQDINVVMFANLPVLTRSQSHT